MRFWKQLLSSVIMALLTGCGAFAYFLTRPNPAIHYSYEIENGHADAIVQVFTLNDETVIQFRELKEPYPKIFDMQSKEMPFTVVGYSYVLKGIHPRFRIVSERGEALLTLKSNALSQKTDALKEESRERGTAGVFPKRNGKNPASEENAGESLTQLRAELEKLKAQLETFTKHQEDRQAATDVSIHSMKMLRYSFADGSSTFDPSPAIREKLAELASTASKITVTGYTYASRASERYRKLAGMRAESARKYLVLLGIQAEKIRTQAIAAGHFVSENTTESGRHKNRRVEIVFFYDE